MRRWRKNDDLHTIPDSYIFIAITGLVFAFSGLQTHCPFTSRAQKLAAHKHPLSGTLATSLMHEMDDPLWQQYQEALKKESLGIYFVTLNADPVEVVVNYLPEDLLLF